MEIHAQNNDFEHLDRFAFICSYYQLDARELFLDPLLQMPRILKYDLLEVSFLCRRNLNFTIFLNDDFLYKTVYGVSTFPQQ